jgi:hypothetical protein
MTTRVRSALVNVVWLFCCSASYAQRPVTFADYPVSLRFHGKPAKPLLNSPNSKTYRTKIREAAALGPNFADHYTLALWGCGSGCGMFSIVDAVDGRVYDAPFTVSWTDERDADLKVIRESCAIHIVGSLSEGANSADRWYVWDGKELKLKSEMPARRSDLEK